MRRAGERLFRGNNGLRAVSAQRVTCLLAAALLASCDSPTSPSKLNFQAGFNWLSIIGYDLDDLAAVAPCGPILAPPAGKALSFPVNLVIEGGDWVARTSADVGDLELRLHSVGSSGAGHTLEGTIRGSAKDAPAEAQFTRDVKVVLAAPQRVTGTLQVVAPFALGRVSGHIVFTDSKGSTGTCTEIDWSMSP